MSVERAAVVGAGTMGGEIAQVIAAAGIPVLLQDVEQRFVDRGLERAEEVTRAGLAALVERGKLDAAQVDDRAGEVLARIVPVAAYEGFGSVDFAIEAVPERIEVKQSVMAELDAACPGHAILASNTSSLSISEMADATTRPERVVGFHFFYPATVMRLIEVVEGHDTSEETARAAARFAQRIRKTAIRCGEAPGFVVNRILNSAVSEVWRAAEAEGLEPADVDRAVAATGRAPVGPYYLTDLLGLDVVLHVAEHLHSSYGDRFAVSAQMRELVAAGHLGRKTGKGFYEHGA